MSSDDERPPARRKGPVRRVAGWTLRAVAIVAVLLVLGVWAWLESADAESRIRRLLQSRATDLLGTPVTIGSVELDVLPFRLAVENVVARGTAADGVPLVRIDAVRVRLSGWRLLQRRITVTSLEVDAPRLHVDTDSLELPEREGGAAGLAVELQRIRIRDGSLELQHRRARLGGELGGLSLTLGPEDGGLDLAGSTRRGELHVTSGRLDLSQRRDRELVLAGLDLDSRFVVEDSAVTVESFRLALADSWLRGSGQIVDPTTADLEVRGDVAAQDLFAFWQPPGPHVHDGTLRFAGSVQLRRGEPILGGHIAADRVTISALPLSALSADLQLREDEIAVRNLSADLYDGHIEGSVVVERDTDPSLVSIQYEATGLDASDLTRWEPLPGLRLEGSLSAVGEASWRQPWRESVAGRGSLTVDLAPPPSVEVGRDSASGSPDPLPGAATPGGQADAPPGPPTTRSRSAQGLVPTLPLAARASLDYELRGGTLLLERSRLELPETTLDVGGRVDLDGELLLAATIESRDLRMLDHLVAQYRAFADGRSRQRRFDVSGQGRIDLRIGGSVDAPILGGELDGRAIVLGDLRIGTVSAGVDTRGRLVTLEPLRIRRQEGDAAGSAVLRLPGGPAGQQPPPATGAPALESPLDYRLDLQLQDYALYFEMPLAGRQLPLTGTTGGRYVLEGSWGAPSTMHFDLALDAPGLGPSSLRSGHFDASRHDDRWEIRELRVDGLGGELRTRGTWVTAPTDRIDLEATARDLDVAGLLELLDLDLPFRGSLSAEGALQGALGDLSGTATARVADAAVGDLSMGAVSASLRAESGVAAALMIGARTAAADLQVPAAPRTTTPGTAPALAATPEGGWSAALTTATSAPWPAALRLRADAGLAGSVFRQLGWRGGGQMQLRGLLEMQASGPLPRPADWRAEGQVGGLRVERAGSTVATARRLELSLRDRRVEAVLDLVSEPGRLSVNASLELDTRRLGGAADGSLDLTLLRLWRGDLRLGGAADADVTLAGTLDDPDLAGRLQLMDASLTGQDWPYDIDGLSGDLVLRADALHLENTAGRFGGRDFAASGTIPLLALTDDPGAEPLDVRLTLEALPLRPLLRRSPTVNRLVDSGSLSGSVRIRGRGTDWRRWSGSVGLDALRLQMGDYGLTLAEPVEARLDAGALVLPEGTRLQGVRSDLQVAGRVELVPIRLDVHTRGELALEPLNVLSDVWGFGGVARVDLDIRGRPPELAYRGEAELLDAVLAPPPLRQPITRIRGHLDFQDRRVVIEDVEGELGGGDVELDGELFLRESKPYSWRYTATADDAQLRLERRVRVRVAADLVHDGTAEQSLLSGDVTLREGIYRRDYQADRAILELMESPETEPDPLLSSVSLALAVQGVEDLVIDNNLARLEVTADFDVRGTLAEPVLLGRSTLLSGELYWYDNTFDLIQGTVEFSNPFETEPIFEISARTTVRSYTVTLNFSGSFERGMNFSYSSTPPLSDLELVNLLTLGSEPDSTVVQQSYEAAIGLQATRFLTEQYLAEVERGAQRFLGIDRFRIAPTLQGARTEPTARLTVGKQLTENVYVTYSRLLDSTEEQLLTVEYQLTRNIRVTGTRDEDGSFGIDFLVQKRFR